MGKCGLRVRKEWRMAGVTNVRSSKDRKRVRECAHVRKEGTETGTKKRVCDG